MNQIKSNPAEYVRDIPDMFYLLTNYKKALKTII